MTMLLWPLLITRLVFTAATTAVVQRKSLSQLPVLELESKGERTQTINTAPITIHIPLPKSHSKHETSDAPAAIASEAPEGTYLLPLTEQRKPVSPPAINLVVNLRLLMDGERKPEQPEALTVVSDQTPEPVSKPNPGEYVAHKVKVMAPNANLNSVPTQGGPSTLSPSSLSAGVFHGDMSTASNPSKVNSPFGAQQPQSNHERMPEQSETAIVASDETPKPVLKPNPEEYVAHEVTVVAPNAHLNSVPTQGGASTSPPLGLSAGFRLGNMSAASPTNVNSPIGRRQPQNNYGSGPSFLLVPKRRVWHNVRSNVKASVPEGTELAKFRHQILFAHNSKRLLHRVPPLTEDQKLDTEAQSFAFKLSRQGNITHSSLEDRLGKGENVALRCSLKVSPLTGTRATNLWYDESKKFNWNAKSVTPATERFTQMVWKSTSKVGFGRAQFKDKGGRTCFVVVARYEPAGNGKATLMDNVFQPSQQGSKLSKKFGPKIKW